MAEEVTILSLEMTVWLSMTSLGVQNLMASKHTHSTNGYHCPCGSTRLGSQKLGTGPRSTHRHKWVQPLIAQCLYQEDVAKLLTSQGCYVDQIKLSMWKCPVNYKEMCMCKEMDSCLVFLQDCGSLQMLCFETLWRLLSRSLQFKVR